MRVLNKCIQVTFVCLKDSRVICYFCLCIYLQMYACLHLRFYQNLLETFLHWKLVDFWSVTCFMHMCFGPQLCHMSLLCSCTKVQFNSVTQSCLTLCGFMDYSMPGFPVHHQLPELAQTHVHWVGDAIQPSHPPSSPSPSAFNLPQHQGLSQWVSSLHQVAKVLALQH